MMTLGKGSLLAADMFAKSRTAEYLGVGKGSQSKLFQMSDIVAQVAKGANGGEAHAHVGEKPHVALRRDHFVPGQGGRVG
jgi:hypothetical protein